MDVLQKALAGTEERKNSNREFHVCLTLLGLPDPVRGTVNVTPTDVQLTEFELSKNGSWLQVEAPPVFIVREVITSARVVYLDGGA